MHKQVHFTCISELEKEAGLSYCVRWMGTVLSHLPPIMQLAFQATQVALSSKQLPIRSQAIDRTVSMMRAVDRL